MEEDQFLQVKVNLVKNGILELLKTAGVSASEYDGETVGTYIIGLIEDADEVDFSDLNDIMLAYIPGFEAVNGDDVKSWVRQMTEKITNNSFLTQTASNSALSTTDAISHNQVELVEETTFPSSELDTGEQTPNLSLNSGETASNTVSTTEDINSELKNFSPRSVRKKCRSRTNSSRKSSESESLCSVSSGYAWSMGSRRMSAGRSVSESSINDQDDTTPDKAAWPSLEESSTATTDQSELDMLLDMFPDLNIGLISKTLEQDKGELELTITHLLDHQAMQEQMMVSPKIKTDRPFQNISARENHIKSRKKKKSQRTRENSQSSADLEEHTEDLKSVDAKTRNKIINKYSFMPEDLEDKTYKPQPSFDESKKMVRYRNGQVVSTRGERFSEVKKDMTDDMKKTFINLKPARKYRFH